MKYERLQIEVENLGSGDGRICTTPTVEHNHSPTMVSRAACHVLHVCVVAAACQTWLVTATNCEFLLEQKLTKWC